MLQAVTLYRALVERLGSDNVFLDVESQIPPGAPFAEHILSLVRGSDLLIAVIGPRCFEPRSDETPDFVRIEIAEAMATGLRVIPFLVGNATMPLTSELPDDLKPLTSLQTFQALDRSFPEDVERLQQELSITPLALPVLPSETEYLSHLKQFILTQSDPPWDPELYTRLNGVELDAPHLGFWVNLLSDKLLRFRNGAVQSKHLDILPLLLRQHLPLVITGPPGSGKSVVLRQFALSLIDKRLRKQSNCLPVLVDLKNYSTSEPFAAFLQRSFEEGSPTVTSWTNRHSSFLSYLSDSFAGHLASGSLVFLLDGMDEMPRDGYAERLSELKRFVRDYPANRFVFTCRTLDYDPRFAVRQIALQELDHQQVCNFVIKSLAKSGFHGLPKQFEPIALNEQRPDLMSACRNPFLLRMLVTYFAINHRLPDDVGELYERFLAHLLTKSKAPSLSLATIRTVLSRVALTLTEREGLGVNISLDDLRDARVFVTPDDSSAVSIALQGGVLVADAAANSIGFVHHRLQEYFAAIALDQRLQTESLAEVLEEYLDDIWSREIVLKLVSISPRASDIVRYLTSTREDVERLLLAAEALQYSPPTVRESHMSQVLPLLRVEALCNEIRVRVKAVKAISWLADPRTTASFLLDRLKVDSSPWVRETARFCLAQLHLRHPEINLAIGSPLKRWWWSARGADTWKAFQRLLILWPFLTFGFIACAFLLGEGDDPLDVYLLFVASYLLGIYIVDWTAYEVRVCKKYGLFHNAILKATLGTIVIAFTVAVGCILLRPEPFVILALAILLSVSFSRRFIVSNDNWSIVTKSLAQFGLPLLAALGYSASEIVPFRDRDYQQAFVPSCFFTLCFTVIVLNWIDVMRVFRHRRALAFGANAYSSRSLVALACEPSPSALGFFQSVSVLIRRRAIRALGYTDLYARDSYGSLRDSESR